MKAAVVHDFNQAPRYADFATLRRARDKCGCVQRR